MTQVPKKLKVITIYSIIDLFKINGSLARRGIQELVKKNLIIPVAPSGTMRIYTRNPANEIEEKPAVDTSKKVAGKQQKGKAKKQVQEDEEEDEEAEQ